MVVELRASMQAVCYRAWMNREVLPNLAHRILSVDQAVTLRAAGLRVPEPRPIGDPLIAATALGHGMTVVTRNVSDFVSTGVNLLNLLQFSSL